VLETGAPAPRNPLAALLKAPWSLIPRIMADRDLPAVIGVLLFWGLVFHAVYGLAMGLFASPGVALVSAAKAPLIALFSVLLCVPSLYVFSCVAGVPVTATQVGALASAAVAMTGLLLLGLTPVAWLFSVSTSNLACVVVINLVAWLIAISFALRFFGLLGQAGCADKTTGFKWWLAIYVVVSLQMATTLRPLLGPCDTGWRESGKKFFVTHFKESLAESETGKKPAQQPGWETR
jgi:hypothetical protein